MSKNKFEVKKRVYFLANDKKPVAYQIRSKHHPRKPLLHTDDEGMVRELRYVSNMNSPFVDEQEGKGIPTLGHIWFRDGVLATNEKETPLQKFLSIHPDNISNGGNLFYEHNPEDDAKGEIEDLEAAADAVAQAKDLDINDASAIVYAEVGSGISRYSSAEIRRDLLMMAMNNPGKLLKYLNDDNVMLSYIAYQALEFGVLKANGNVITLGASKKKLLQIKPGETAVEGVSSYFLTDDGLAALEEVKAKLKKLLS